MLYNRWRNLLPERLHVAAALVGISLLLQFSAAALAFRIAFRTRYWAWLPLASAILLMGVHRAYSFGSALFFGNPADWKLELIALAISVLMLAGVVSLGRARHRTLEERRQRAEALRYSEERFRLFMDHSPAVAYIKDAEGRFVYLNRTLRRTFRIAEEDWLGKTVRDVLPPDFAKETEENDRKVMAAGEPLRFEEKSLGEDGQLRYWLTYKFPLKDPEGHRLLGGISLDVTDQVREAEGVQRRLDATEKARAELEELDRLKDEFLSNVSHELRTPLTAILGFQKLLFREKAGPLTDEQKDLLKTSQNNAQRLLQTVQNLLDYSRIRAGAFEYQYRKFWVEKLLVSSVESVLSQVRLKNIALAILPPKEDLQMEGDPERLGQCLTNLLSNAVKFTPTRGRIELGARKEGDRILFWVQDTGIGVAPEDRIRIFERFYQVDGSATRRQGGSGLGLAIVREVVRGHGGSVEVESERGKGTTFRLLLPHRQSKAPVENDGGGGSIPLRAP